MTRTISPTTLAEIQEATANLTPALATNPVTALAVATAWLNPLHMERGDDDFDAVGFYGDWDERESEGVVRFVLGIARDCFPELYARMLKGMASSWTSSDVSAAFCGHINRRWPHIPLRSIYDMSYGIPMEFWGMGWYTTDTEMPFPELVSLVGDWFWRGEYDTDPETLHDTAWPIAKALIRSLVGQDRQPYADLALLFLYLFSATNDTLLDMTEEDFAESGFDWMGWNITNLDDMEWAYINLRVVLDAKDRALAVLETEPDIAEALEANIEIVREAVEAGVDAFDTRSVFERKSFYAKLTWPERDRLHCAARSYRRATGADAGLLYVRAYFAEK